LWARHISPTFTTLWLPCIEAEGSFVRSRLWLRCGNSVWTQFERRVGTELERRVRTEFERRARTELEHHASI
jgi:hypothetical protein